MKIMLSGSSGLIGSALLKSLRIDGCEVVILPRSYADVIDLTGIDAVVHLAGESITNGRWTEAKKLRIKESRVMGTRQLAEQLSSSVNKPSVFICASAIGYYGIRSDEQLDEESSAGEGFLSTVCQEWERASDPASESGIRTVNIRTGIVLSKEGGALNKMLLPFRLGGGGIIGNGLQYMSWISLLDMVKMIRFIIDTPSINGPVNLVSPNPVTNREFTKTLGKLLHRPTILPLPAFAARLIFGEMANELLLSSCRVYPKKMKEAGYIFSHSNLRSALENLLR